MAPYSLDWGETVHAKVSASNIKGESPYSSVSSGGTIARAPDTPINFAQNPVQTSATSIGLQWNAGLTYYGYPIIDYAVSWDEGNGDSSIVLLEMGLTDTSTTLSNVLKGVTYTFYVQARSEYGFSAYTDAI